MLVVGASYLPVCIRDVLLLLGPRCLCPCNNGRTNRFLWAGRTNHLAVGCRDPYLTYGAIAPAGTFVGVHFAATSSTAATFATLAVSGLADRRCSLLLQSCRLNALPPGPPCPFCWHG